MEKEPLETPKPVGIFVDNGKVSFSRVTGAVMSGAYLLLALMTVWGGNDFPDVPQNLALLIAGLYGLNKLPQVFKK